jgi:hypothetical protein
MKSIAQYRLATMADAGGENHPTVRAYLVNRAQLAATTDLRTALTLTLQGAELWRAVVKRARYVRAARKGWQKRKR